MIQTSVWHLMTCEMVIELNSSGLWRRMCDLYLISILIICHHRYDLCPWKVASASPHRLPLTNVAVVLGLAVQNTVPIPHLQHHFLGKNNTFSHLITFTACKIGLCFIGGVNFLHCQGPAGKLQVKKHHVKQELFETSCLKSSLRTLLHCPGTWFCRV